MTATARRQRPDSCPTCGHTPRAETRSYRDRAEYTRRAARALGALIGLVGERLVEVVR